MKIRFKVPSSPVPIVLCLATILLTVAAQGPSSGNATARYVPRDNILLNCGSSGPFNDTDGRSWTGDTGSKYAPSLTSGGPSASSQDSSVPSVPYLTARVFTSPFTYSFPLGPGRKFLRLHFYPSNYSSLAASDALFSVTAGPGITLLSNFSAYQTAEALNFAYLVHEFSLSVSSSGLNLTFAPTPGRPNAYAFVNGIEIVSTPDDLFNSSNPIFVGTSTTYSILPDWALQTVYRLNVGGQAISPTQDSGLYRTWVDDTPYIYGAGFGVTYSADSNVSIHYSAKDPEYMAPINVYSTARSMGPEVSVNTNFNLTWIFQVDAGFYYLLRFHFCEISIQ